jgi:hypothetical protein
MCEPVEGQCAWGPFDPIVTCDDCTLATPPDQTNACDGTESIENPDSCAAGVGEATYKLTMMAIAEDCNVGFNIDSCAGETCARGMLASDDGTDGVDNGLAALTPKIEPLGTSLTGVDQAFYDSLCGLTNDLTMGVCVDGDDAGDPCAIDDDCMGTCNTDNDDCQQTIAAAEIFITIDVNVADSCATVQVTSGESTTTSILNVGTPTVDATICVSGQLEDIPIALVGVDGNFANPSVRATISEAGLSDGILGTTVDSDTATAIAAAISPIAAGLVDQTFDISADLTQDPSAACDALSMTVKIGGVPQAPAP